MKNIQKILLGIFAMLLLSITFNVNSSEVFAALRPNSTVVNDGGGGHSHTGGTATCTKKAVCSSCGKEYGELASHNMSGYKKFTDGSTYKHRKECQNEGCNYTESTGKCSSNSSMKYNDTQHYTHCDTCGRNWAYKNHSVIDCYNETQHWQECQTSSCGYEVNRANHGERVVDVDNEDGHDIRCSTTWCNYYTTKLRSESHTYPNNEGVDEHICSKCNFKSTKYPHHGFGSALNCTVPNCDAVITVSGGSNINALPFWNEYHMVGCGKEWEESIDTDTFTTNYTPYVSYDSDSIMELTLQMMTFVHGNYAFHASEWSESHSDEENLANTTWPKENIPNPISMWQRWTGTMEYGTPTTSAVTFSYSNKTYTCSNFPNGHWLIDEVHLGKFEVMGPLRLYTKGVGSCSNYTNIYAYLKVAYRDMEGNPIAGAPQDLRKTVVTWRNGNTGNGFNPSANLTTLDTLGWRYKGYKYGKSYNIPSNIDGSGTLNTATSRSIETSLGNQTHYIVFFFEPIKLEIKHTNSGALINTNKNGTYSLPFIHSLTANPNHNCATLGCSGTVGNVITHNNTSLNKVLWPAYILKGYNLKTADGTKTIINKTYKLDSEDSGNDELTTRLPTANDINLPEAEYKNLYQKTASVSSNQAISGYKAGYRPDMILEFVYDNTSAMVSHRIYEKETVLTDITGQTKLEYGMDVKTDNFVIPSLITTDQNYLPALKCEYDISGYIIRQVKVLKDGKKEIFSVDINKENEELNKNTIDYYTLETSINPEIKKEIRNGGKLQVIFYYEFVNKLIVKYVDDQDNALYPEVEYTLKNDRIINHSEKTNGLSTKYNYKLIRYELDTTDKVEDPQGTEIMVPANGQNRVLKLVYSKVMPMLETRYVDETGQPLPNISSKRENIAGTQIPASAQDFTNISYQYVSYVLYEGSEVDGNAVTSSGGDVNVIINNNGNDRLLIFIYKKVDEDVTPDPINPSETLGQQVILRSNDRDNEEYNVLRAIPTSEDLYANVITDSYLIRELVSQTDETAQINVTFVMQYTDSSNSDALGGGRGEDVFKAKRSAPYSLEVPYTYTSARNAKLDIINKAIVKNGAIISIDNGIVKNGEVRVDAKYNGKEPYMDYIAGGKVDIKDLANDAIKSKGSVYQYIEDTGKEQRSGFYSVSTDGNTINVEYLLPEAPYVAEGIDEYFESKVEEYTSNAKMLTTALVANGAKVTSDTLKVHRENGTVDTIFSGKKLEIGEEYTLFKLQDEGYINLNVDKLLKDRDVLYRNTGIYVSEEATNDYYNDTVADIYYISYQEIGSDLTVTNIDEIYRSEYIPEGKKDVPGNLISVHTPVVNDTSIKDNKGDANNQIVDASKLQGYETLVLGHEFTIKIPHTYTHINETGYGKNHYNYNGIHYQKNSYKPESNGLENNLDAFAKERQIKFTFGVIYVKNTNKKVYYPANEWITLEGNEKEEFTFIIPEWEKELWIGENHHTINTRVIAENCPIKKSNYSNVTEYNRALDNSAYSQGEANKDKSKYIATSSVNVKVIGELIDLEIRGTNDPGWTQLTSSLETSKFPIGQPGQNAVTAYKYGLKLGTTVYFDITSTGWTGDTTEKVNIDPKYFFVSKAGGEAREVDLYYKRSATGAYIKLSDSNPIDVSTIMSQDTYKGKQYISRFAKNNLFINNAAKELSTTYNLMAKYRGIKANYAQKVSLLPMINLPYITRLAYVQAIESLKTDKYVGLTTYNHNLEIATAGLPNVDGTDYCVGHWYGAMRLPSTTIAVEKTKITPPKTKDEGLKDGYIIVAFEDVNSVSKKPDGTPVDYLEYAPIRYDLELPENQEFELPNGNEAEIPDNNPNNPIIPAIIYELVADRIDYETGGTH